ncbi:ChrR family anti-sigma-E factor [Oceaniglobus roseus]|uniref:ChrR family anti-sigma-E factor n=1 Tax=Oceaniglobus roseus TaxID=1737570 RepID=UPI000C7F16E8|nr:ChrR family anti-sigma-E factor [Kandeliimicrobium roseum]
MSKITHHLSEPLLMGYAAGSLPEAFSLLVASHVSLCDECRAQLETYETLGGVVLDGCGTCEMAPGALDDAMARILCAPPAPEAARPGKCPVLPRPLVEQIGGGLDAVRWRPLGGGVRHARLKADGSATVRLLHIPAGTKVPDHGHRGIELTMVLQGAFSDGDERFGRGDVEIADADLHHTPVAEAGQDCICLAVTDAPLKFNGVLQRLVQPFLGI